MRLTRDEYRVLKWISEEDFAPIGPVEGDAFRHLVALGIVDVRGEGCHLTDYGWEVVTDIGDELADAATGAMDY